MLALCDCNNFFVSCERLYHPELAGRPVVVLSSNDGCVISRSAEVKAMGIPMGEAYFRVRRLLERKGVAVLSGNHKLYRNVSRRVMELLGRYTDHLEVYSIDEAFLNLSIAAVRDPLRYVAEIREQTARLIGVPVSIGVAPTKTLAKIATDRAKKSPGSVSLLTREELGEILKEVKIEEVWGIGRRTAQALREASVFTTEDFVRKDPLWVRKKFTVRGLMTQHELMGYPCIQMPPAGLPPKSIQVSRSFGSCLAELEDLHHAVIEHIVKAARTLRKHRLAAGGVKVYLLQGFVSREHRYLNFSRALEKPMRSDLELIRMVTTMLRTIYEANHRAGDFYTKAGVVLFGLSDARFRQRELFEPEGRKYERLAEATDEINRQCGYTAIYPACLAAAEKNWRPVAMNRSSLEMPLRGAVE